MQSVASLMIVDTSFDIGNIEDIDNDDDDADDEQRTCVTDSASRFAVTSQTEETCDSSAHGALQQ